MHEITENWKEKKTKMESELTVLWIQCKFLINAGGECATNRPNNDDKNNYNNNWMQCAIERKTNGQSKSIFMLHLSSLCLLLPVSHSIGMPACRMVIRSADQHNLWCMTVISSSNGTIKLYRVYSIWHKSINKHILLRVIHLSNTHTCDKPCNLLTSQQNEPA